MMTTSLDRPLGCLRLFCADAWTWLRCGVLQQHDDVRMFAPERLYCRCLRCGRSTVGIHIGPGAPVLLPASFVNVDQVREERRARVARLQARMRL